MLSSLILVMMSGVGSFGSFGPSVNGMEEPFPYCNGVTVVDSKPPIGDMRGTLVATSEVRPCLGQASYVVAELTTPGGGKQRVYLAPREFLDANQMPLTAGEEIHLTTIHAGRVTAALKVDAGGHQLILRDAQGRPRWENHAFAH